MQILTKKAGEVITITTTKKKMYIQEGYLSVKYEYMNGDEALLFVQGKRTYLDPSYVYKCLTDVDLVLMPNINHPEQDNAAKALFFKTVEGFNMAKTHIDVRKKILHFIWINFLLYGERTGQNLSLPFEISHEEIACGAGTTRVTVTRMMKDFRGKGWIITQRKEPMQMTLVGQVHCSTLFT